MTTTPLSARLGAALLDQMARRPRRRRRRADFPEGGPYAGLRARRFGCVDDSAHRRPSESNFRHEVRPIHAAPY